MSDNDPKNMNPITLRRFLKWLEPFSTKKITLFTLLARGDLDKEKRFIFRGIQIEHTIIFSTIPIAILLLFLGLRWPGIDSHSSILPNGIVVIYILSLIFGFLGYKWLRIIKWYYFWSTFDFGMYTNHFFRIGMFETGVFFGFVSGMAGANIFALIPLFLFEGMALYLTYPSKDKWKQWEIYQRRKDEIE